jgi:hypothetical protein
LLERLVSTPETPGGTVVEYGLFNELDRTEGCFEAGMYSREEAEARRLEYIAQGEEPEDVTVEELCPEHEGQAKSGCEQCAADEDAWGLDPETEQED